MMFFQRSCLLALGLLAVGCGGVMDDASFEEAGATSATSKAGHGPVAQSGMHAHVDTQADSAMPLRDWLARLSRLHRVRVCMDPSIEGKPVAAAMPSSISNDELASALADFEVLLGYASHGGHRAVLASVHVLPRGGTAASLSIDPRACSAKPTPAAEPDPLRAMQQTQRGPASSGAAVRNSALERSFELEAPLPSPTLLAALQVDASSEARRFALIARARHPEADPVRPRAMAQVARSDRDPAVRANALEVVESLDAVERAE